MKKQNFILAIALATLLFSSCKTMQIEKPKESYLPSTISPAISELPLKVELDVKKLELAVNNKMNGTLFEASNISGQDLSLKVWKAQNFTFTINNNVIEYRVPLKVWTRFAWKVEKFGLSIGDYYEANGSIALTYKTIISIDKNWKLVSTTSSSGYQWIETPKLNIAGVSVPVTPLASFALNRCDQIISNQIDKSLSEAVDLKKYLSQAWTLAQTPQQVNAENDVWIKIIPQDILVSPFTTVGNKLDLSIALHAQIESYMGVKPVANSFVTLPPFKQADGALEQFNLNIGADVTYLKIAEMAKSQLLNKTFTQGNKSITITDLSIYGSEGKAVFVADVIGSLKGRIYFKGNMTYNSNKVAIEILNPEFDIKTQNSLTNTASWLLHGIILKQLTPYLTYPIKDELDKVKSDVNTMMKNYSIMDGISLQGNLNNINVLSLNLVPGALRVQVNLKGSVSLKVNDLKF